LIRSGIVSWNDPTNLRRAFTEGDIQLQGEIIESVVIRNLTITRVTIANFSARGGGKWSSPEWPPWLAPVPRYGNYVITYALPESPEGSCHQIKVKVNRRNAFVLARREYCYTKHSASDALNGTMLGKQAIFRSMLPWKKIKRSTSSTSIRTLATSRLATKHSSFCRPVNTMSGSLSATEQSLAEPKHL
jgi:hypothetical protein